MNQPVYAFLYTLWNLLIAAGGPLNGAKVLPYGNPINPTLSTIYADLGPITVPGITPQTILWQTPKLQPDQSVGVLGNMSTWRITNALQGCTILGFMIFIGPGGSGTGTGALNTLLYAELLPAPVTLFDVTQMVGYVPELEVGLQGTQWGSGTLVT